MNAATASRISAPPPVTTLPTKYRPYNSFKELKHVESTAENGARGCVGEVSFEMRRGEWVRVKRATEEELDTLANILRRLEAQPAAVSVPGVK